MKLIALALGIVAFLATPQPATGEATYYNPGIMQDVYAYRLRTGEVQPCPECVGMVALLRAQDIGRRVWLQHPDGSIIGPLLVVDCAGRQHIPALVKRGWIVDVSWELSRLWNMRGPIDGVTVHYRPPRRMLPGRPHVIVRCKARTCPI